MRVALVCNDTRGGVQPYVALGLGLKQAGHRVRAVAPAELASMFSDHGLPVSALDPAVENGGRATAVAEMGTIASMRFMARELPHRIGRWTAQTLSACENADALMGGVGGMVIGRSVAEKLGVPFVEAHLQPVGLPSRDYAGPMLGRIPPWIGGTGRLLSHRLSDLAIWLPFASAMKQARKNVLGLAAPPRTTDDRLPILFGFSRVVVPAPLDPRRCVTGYWTLPVPAGWTPPIGLASFLDRDGPVVCIGFGSIASSDPQALTALVVGAIRQAEVRAVLLSGWGALRETPSSDDIYCADAVPHEWLYPRVTAAVHHGGAGTTAAAIRAGIPSIVIPFAVDQPFWASRIAALGIGPPAIPRARLTQNALASALRQAVDDERMRVRAAEVGRRVCEEDGVATAVAAFGRFNVA